MNLMFSGAESLLNPQLLSDKEALYLQLVSFLCQWCSAETPVGRRSVIECDVRTADVTSLLLDLLDEEVAHWDSSKAYDLQLVSIKKT